jgi:putative intracellular protease/amidase
MSTLVVLYPGCVFYEIAAAISLLGSGQKVAIASPNGKAVIVAEGIEIQATYNYDEVDVSNLKYALIPGGDCESAMNRPDLNSLLKEIANLPGCLMGGICNGALVLANAGLLNGVKCTHTAIPKYAPVPEFQELLEFATPRFASSIYIDQDVVVDGRIVTAKPWAPVAFAVQMAILGGQIKIADANATLQRLGGSIYRFQDLH